MAKIKRGISLLLVLVFVVTLLPVNALADDLQGDELAMLRNEIVQTVMDNSQGEQEPNAEESSAGTNVLKDTLDQIIEVVAPEAALDKEFAAVNANTVAPLAEETAETGDDTDAPAEEESTINTIGQLISGLGDKINDDNLGGLTGLLDKDLGDLTDGDISTIFDALENGVIDLKDGIGSIGGEEEPSVTDKLLEALGMVADADQGQYDSLTDALEALKNQNGTGVLENMSKVFGPDSAQKIADLIGLENNPVLEAITGAFSGGIPSTSDGIAAKLEEVLGGFDLGLGDTSGLVDNITTIISKLKGTTDNTESASLMSVQEGVSNNMVSTMALSEEQADAAVSSSKFTALAGSLLKSFDPATVVGIITSALSKAGVDEFDELDEVWDEILDEFNMDDIDLDFITDLIGGGADISIEDLIAMIGGNTGSIDWDGVFGDLNLGGDLLAKFKTWLEANGGSVDVDWILNWFRNNTTCDISTVLKLIIAKLGGGSGDFDIEAIIKLITGTDINTDIDITIITNLLESLSGKCDLSALLELLAGFGGQIEIGDLQIVLQKFIELGGKCDISVILDLLAQFGGGIDFGSFTAILEYLISLGGSFDLSVILEYIKNIDFSGSADFLAFLRGMLEILTGAFAGGFDFSTLINFLLSLKGELGIDWSGIFEWLSSIKTKLGIDWSAFFKLILDKLMEFGGNFAGYIKLIINWLISLLDPKTPTDPKDPIKDPSDPITDPQTPLKPYDPSTIIDPQTPLSPITGDSTDYLSIVLMAVLALLSLCGMAVFARPVTVSAGETEEAMGMNSFETERESYSETRRNEKNQTKPKK